MNLNFTVKKKWLHLILDGKQSYIFYENNSFSFCEKETFHFTLIFFS